MWLKHIWCQIICCIAPFICLLCGCNKIRSAAPRTPWSRCAMKRSEAWRYKCLLFFLRERERLSFSAVTRFFLNGEVKFPFLLRYKFMSRMKIRQQMLLQDLWDNITAKHICVNCGIHNKWTKQKVSFFRRYRHMTAALALGASQKFSVDWSTMHRVRIVDHGSNEMKQKVQSGLKKLAQ